MAVSWRCHRGARLDIPWPPLGPLQVWTRSWATKLHRGLASLSIWAVKGRGEAMGNTVLKGQPAGWHLQICCCFIVSILAATNIIPMLMFQTKDLIPWLPLVLLSPHDYRVCWFELHWWLQLNSLRNSQAAQDILAGRICFEPTLMVLIWEQELIGNLWTSPAHQSACNEHG